MKKLTSYLYYYEETYKKELSSDVFLIKGQENNYLFDVGCDKDLLNEIDMSKIKYIFISHFHEDHVGLIPYFDVNKIYVSKYTFKKLNVGNVISNFIIDDNIHIEVKEIPSPHEKGSLIVIINNEVTLLGDAIYESSRGYNVSKLYNLINYLKKINTKYFILSHKVRLIKKDVLILYLEDLLSRQKKNEIYIKVNKDE